MKPKAFKILLLLFGLLIVTFLALTVATTYAASVKDIANQVFCQCGCDMILSKCNEDVCFPRDAMLGLINQKLDQGQPQEEIIQSFVAQYGEQVLASPAKRGFHLTIWVVPFAVILLEGVVICVNFKKWRRRGEETTEITTG